MKKLAMKLLLALCVFLLCRLSMPFAAEAQQTVHGHVPRYIKELGLHPLGRLDSIQSANSWIEVYNPTDGPLVLQRIRLSHLKTINVFLKSIQDQGGIQIGAGQHVILCANDSSFKSLYGMQVKTIAVTALSRLASGGFVAITTRGAGEAKGVVVRYGKTEMSSDISKLAGDQVVSFSKEGKSFIREVTITKAGIGLSDFVESPAQPGKSNN